MSVEVSPQSRVQLLNIPIAAPGHCVLCGSASTEDRKYIDFGFQMDWYGAVYFCTICFEEVATAIGWISQEHSELFATKIKTALSDNERLKEISKTQGMMLLELAGNCHCGIFGDYDSGTPGPSDIRDDTPISVDESAAGSDSDIDKSVSVEGSSSIHNTGKRKLTKPSTD